MVKTGSIDYVLGGIVVALLGAGIIILASISASLSLERFETTYYFLNHQLIFGIIPGLFALFLFLKIPLDFLKKWAPFFLLINIFLVAMVFLPKIGLTLGGATRWLYFGAGAVFQPSEFLKLTFVLYLASLLASRTEKKTYNSAQVRRNSSLQTLAVFLTVASLISLFLTLQPDISTLGIVVLVGFIIYFSSRTPLWHSLLVLAGGISALYALIKLAPYRAHRWLVFLNPEIDPLGIGYQLKQSLIAVGSGGILGLGLGMSRQKFGFLPQSMTDSVFAVFAEETGLLGALALLLVFLTLLWRGFKVAKKVQDKFAKLTALGISSWLCLQAFANIGTMIGVLPIAGIPLPFISYGGSHLVAELAGAGILLNISRNV